MAMNLNRLKHIKYFSNYIAEQDFAGEVPAAAAAPVEPIYSVLFIEEGNEGSDYTFPDGSSSKRYNTFTIRKADLEDWIDSNVTEESTKLSKSAVKVKREAIFDYISGVKDSVTPDDKKHIIKFKNAIQTGMIGKKTQDTEVVFSPKDKVPTTDAVEVTFITTKK